MTEDIVERLRAYTSIKEMERQRHEAADEIARLRIRCNSQELELRQVHTACAELQDQVADWRSRYDAADKLVRDYYDRPAVKP